jgi:hypothetical protein
MHKPCSKWLKSAVKKSENSDFCRVKMHLGAALFTQTLTVEREAIILWPDLTKTSRGAYRKSF